jgi:hypothetical protein
MYPLYSQAGKRTPQVRPGQTRSGKEAVEPNMGADENVGTITPVFKISGRYVIVQKIR